MRLTHYSSLMGAAAKVELARLAGRPTLPYKLEYILTYACGSRCRTCNIWKRYIETPEEQEREMVSELIKQPISTSFERLYPL